MLMENSTIKIKSIIVWEKWQTMQVIVVWEKLQVVIIWLYPIYFEIQDLDIINITEHKRNEYHERILKSDFSYKCDSNFGFLTREESPSPPLMTKLSTRDRRDLHPIALPLAVHLFIDH